jgi:hypothetical protein
LAQHIVLLVEVLVVEKVRQLVVLVVLAAVVEQTLTETVPEVLVTCLQQVHCKVETVELALQTETHTVLVEAVAVLLLLVVQVLLPLAVTAGLELLIQLQEHLYFIPQVVGAALDLIALLALEALLELAVPEEQVTEIREPPVWLIEEAAAVVLLTQPVVLLVDQVF